VSCFLVNLQIRMWFLSSHKLFPQIWFDKWIVGGSEFSIEGGWLFVVERNWREKENHNQVHRKYCSSVQVRRIWWWKIVVHDGPIFIKVQIMWTINLNTGKKFPFFFCVTYAMRWADSMISQRLVWLNHGSMT